MNRKILIVDDEPCILRALQFQLERVGDMEVITAVDGEEAERLIREEQPCLILLDVMLPKKNGYEICEWIKTTPELAGTYVIILSAKGQEHEISRGIELGADEYMTKPFDPEGLLKRTQEIMASFPAVIES